MYLVHRLPDRPIGHARTLDHALILADAGGPSRYEVLLTGDQDKHLFFITRRQDGTFIVDPRYAGGLTAALSPALTPA